jgi:hypothetical protein
MATGGTQAPGEFREIVRGVELPVGALPVPDALPHRLFASLLAGVAEKTIWILHVNRKPLAACVKSRPWGLRPALAVRGVLLWAQAVPAALLTYRTGLYTGQRVNAPVYGPCISPPILTHSVRPRAVSARRDPRDMTRPLQGLLH